MKKLRVLLLVHEELVPPTESISFKELEKSDFKTEYQIQDCLKKLGHEVHVLGVGDETLSIRRSVEDYKPQVAFNLLEEFAGQATFDQHVVSFLELLNLKYTGCNPQGLMVARNKGLAKKLLKYHRIPTPDFYIFNFKSNLEKLKKLKYPLFVKSLTEEASLGITQDSIVHSKDQLNGRIKYFYENYESSVIAEDYIEGREFYVGVVGNHKLKVFTPWELKFNNISDRTPKIATRKVKWDLKYRLENGIESGAAEDLNIESINKMKSLAKRTYKALGLSGYARIDMRMNSEGQIFVIEANPNPDISYDEDFAESAQHYGLKYENLVQSLLTLGISWNFQESFF